MLFRSLVSSFFVALACAQNSSVADATADAAKKPKAPDFDFLYTSFVTLDPALDYGSGPYGDRLIIPITGGNFSGPGLKGKILDIGGDWGLFDVHSNGTLFHPDTRYHFQTKDGANIYVRSQGSTTATGDLHLRFIYETGSPAYYWLNNIIAVGIGTSVGAPPGQPGAVLRIDTWHIADEPTS